MTRIKLGVVAESYEQIPGPEFPVPTAAIW